MKVIKNMYKSTKTTHPKRRGMTCTIILNIEYQNQTFDLAANSQQSANKHDSKTLRCHNKMEITNSVTSCDTTKIKSIVALILNISMWGKKKKNHKYKQTTIHNTIHARIKILKLGSADSHVDSKRITT